VYLRDIMVAAFGFSSPRVLFPLGAALLSGGGLFFHMSQFHIAQLFPRHKGLISSLFVGGFITSGLTFEVLRQVFNAARATSDDNHAAYRTVMLVHACLCVPFLPGALWMTPKESLKLGDTVTFTGFSFRVIPGGQMTTAAPETDSSEIPSALPLESTIELKQTPEVHVEMHRRRLAGDVAASPPSEESAGAIKAEEGEDSGNSGIQTQAHRIRRCWSTSEMLHRSEHQRVHRM
jgi:hypothetical protein